MPTARWKTPVVSKGQQHNEPALYSAHSRMSEMKFGSGHSLSMGAPLSCPMPGVFVASQLSLLWRAPFPPQTNKQPTNLKTEEINYKCLDRKWPRWWANDAMGEQAVNSSFSRLNHSSTECELNLNLRACDAGVASVTNRGNCTVTFTMSNRLRNPL